jgi:hypothetical protein
MLPGSFVETRVQCGKPNCRCADGKQLHVRAQVSMLIEGRLRTFHVPAALAADVRAQVELYKRAHATIASIGAINLRRFLRHKKEARQSPRSRAAPV